MFSQPFAKAEELWTPKPYVETGLYSDYVFPSGSIVPSAVRQDLVSLQLPGGFDTSLWENYSFKEKKVNEVDFGINYTRNLTDSLTINAGVGYWSYPTDTFGDDDIVANLGLTYTKGPFKTKISNTHLFSTKDTEAGDSLCAKLTASLPSTNLGKIKVNSSLNLSTAYNKDYYGCNGLAHTTAGATVGLSLGNWSLNGQLNYQQGLQDEMPTTEYSGLSLGYQFP